MTGMNTYSPGENIDRVSCLDVFRISGKKVRTSVTKYESERLPFLKTTTFPPEYENHA